MSRSTVALTTALSKDSDTSRTPSTATIHSTLSVPGKVPVLWKPNHAAIARQMPVKRNDPL